MAAAKAQVILSLPTVEIRWFKEITEFEYKVELHTWERDRLLAEFVAIAEKRSHCRGTFSSAFEDEEAVGGLAHPFGLRLGGGTGWRDPFIFLNAAPSPERIWYLVGHELKHLADYRDQKYTTASIRTVEGRQIVERWADEFGQEIARAMGAIIQKNTT